MSLLLGVGTLYSTRHFRKLLQGSFLRKFIKHLSDKRVLFAQIFNFKLLSLGFVAVCTEFYLCVETSPKLPPPLRATWLASSQLFGSCRLFPMLHPWLSSHHSLMLFSHSCPAPTDYLTACCYFYLVASLLSCLNQLLLCLSSPSVCKIAG